MLGAMLHTTTLTSITPEMESAIAADVNLRINTEFRPDELLRPSAELKTRIGDALRRYTTQAIQQRGLKVSAVEESELADRLVAQMLGLGFLERILATGNVAEIAGNPDGSWWIMRRGDSVFAPIATRPSVVEVRGVLDKILGPLGRRVTEAEPIVVGKLPPSPEIPAGARINIVAPPIANGAYPAVNIRFYEDRPVQRELIVERWQMLGSDVWDFLLQAIQQQARILIAGSTGSGKTTLLSALAGTIPAQQRVLLCEDPSEIFVDHPQVVRLEGRPPTSEGKYEVSMGGLVTTAMRMTPKWLVVGEIRLGAAALWLFRAQMSDHPGLSTIHSDSPASAIGTICLLAQMTEEHVPFAATKYLLTRAIDLIVQIGYDRHNKRRVKQIVQVEPELVRGEVSLTPLWELDDAGDDAQSAPRWMQVGQLARRRR
jgi:pilus assembly protein CpaF